MILRRLVLYSTISIVLLHLPTAQFEKTGPVYDTNDWIPITPDNNLKPINRESKSSDRILNIDTSGERFTNDGKFQHRKPARPTRKHPHMKRSPNQRPRIKLEQPYRFESILSPPPKYHKGKGFPQKVQYQQGFNVQPQYQFSPGNSEQSFGKQPYQSVAIPQRYNLNAPQIGQSIPQYSTIPVEVQYQLPSLIPQTNNTILPNPGPELYDAIQRQNLEQTLKLNGPRPTEDKETVQLLYVPLEQLQKQQNLNSGILDDAFRSLQQQKLVAQPTPQETILQEHKPQALPLVSQDKPTGFPKYFDQFVPQDQSSFKQNQQPTKYFELISQNRGELVLQNNPKTVHVTTKQQFQVQSEPQEIVELTSKKPILEQAYIQRQKLQEPQIQQTRNQIIPKDQIQQTGNQLVLNAQEVQQTSPVQFIPNEQQVQQTRDQFIQREQTQNRFIPSAQQVQNADQFIPSGPQVQQTYFVQQQVKNPVTIQSPQLQQSYVVQNQPDGKSYFTDSKENSQQSRLASIQRDILQQTLEVEKLQKQIQQGKSIDFQSKNNVQPPKKRKPHQPPLAVYMEGNNQGDIEAVLEALKNAKSIAVQDQIGPNSPQVFVGPSNLNTPEGFAKFPLPYLSSLDNNRIQRKAQQLPFFVAPLNYREPDGYSKIPLPSPHVGSVVVSRFNLRPNQNQLDTLQESNGAVQRFNLRQNQYQLDPTQEPNGPVPITNYKFVNPAFESSLENNSNFDNNLNVYSLESSGPRESPNRHLKEQTLFQQITGFSGFEFPQNQYFQDVNPQPELNTPDQAAGNDPTKPVRPPTEIPSRQRDRGETRGENKSESRGQNRGETQRGTKKANSILKDSNTENSEKNQPERLQPERVQPERVQPERVQPERVQSERVQPERVQPERVQSERVQPERLQPERVQPDTRFQEISPEIYRRPETVEVSSPSSLTQDFLNRFGANNNQNFNFVSSTPGYAVPSQSNIEEIPANIRKLNVRPSQNIPDQRNQHGVYDANFEQTIENLQNTRAKPVSSKEEEENRQIVRDFEQYELPPQLTNINPNLPGLINELQDQNQPQTTTFRYETNPVTSTRTPPSTTQYTIRTTEATPPPTTTRKSRGRGKSRFNMKTTTSAPYRRPTSDRRRPSKTTTESNSGDSYRVSNYENVERVRPRTRLQETLSERVSESSVETTSQSQLQYQPITRVMEISQNQPNYFMEFQSTIDNERPVLSQSVEEPQTEGPSRVVEQYQSQKVTTAKELAEQREELSPIRQSSVINAERSGGRKTEVTQAPTETEKPTRRRVRVRGRPKNKYSSTTIAPRTTTPSQSQEQTEFYGFIRQPNFPQSSQINNQNEEENIHIYAPTQQKTSPVYIQRNYESFVTSSPRMDTETTVQFLGELRPKYLHPSRGTTTQSPEVSSTQRSRTRGRVRVPGRPYEGRTTSQEHHTTERSSRGRVRGRTHFTPPRNTRQEEADETENYPASYLRNRATGTTPSNSAFKITVDAGDERDDQIPYSTINRAQKHRDTPSTTTPLPASTTINNEDEKNYIERDEERSPSRNLEIMSFRDERMKQEGFKVVNVDQFDTAESQNYRSLFNDIGGPMKLNELKSKEVEEPMTVTPMSSKEKEYLGLVEPNPTDSSENVSTIEALMDFITAEALRNSIEMGNSSVTTTTTTEEGSVEFSSTLPTDSIEGGEITSTMSSEEEIRLSTSTQAPKASAQTALDLLALQTSTSTEISQETEICYKGRCVKSRNRKLRKPVS